MEEKITQQSRNEKTHHPEPNNNRNKNKKPIVWDCGSSLYDSFELNSFKRQLDSAIVSRTISMPHLPDRRAPLVPQPQPPVTAAKKSSSSSPSKISKSIHKFIKSMFKSNKQSSSSLFKRHNIQGQSDEYWIISDKTGALTTIPEAPEIDHIGGGLNSPDNHQVNSLVRRTASDRFTTTIAISCS